MDAAEQVDSGDRTTERPEPAEHLIDAEVVDVVISSLGPALSPRTEGVKEEHVRLLAESDDPLPPITVHRDTLRVIDGMHRLRVAQARGETLVPARFYSGDERDAFALAVRLNTQHGLPLSLPDRLAAAARVMRSHPEWSDRMIAALAGLAHKTVWGIRHRAGADLPERSFRRGQDGRTRPVSSAGGRRLAAELIVERPQASLREISREAGIAVATVRDVRDRVRSGADPVPERHRGDEVRLPERPRPPQTQAVQNVAPVDPQVALRALRQDPSLRFNDVGRAVLRLLEAGSVDPGQWARLATSVPPHCADLVIEISRGCAEAYLQFAQQLEKKMHSAM
ncbi:ParB/RepB/Spo0J family partition protein [Umezawaea tangerina]|uniref:ParB/RepB/Spo0J family partition protein n=1 Tax=Umezawaea tangerina TaxID=84725 RepID=UPI001FE58B27|nr:ParB/RepB/Spo0J family partition protein [Umezawaea tangerina]